MIVIRRASRVWRLELDHLHNQFVHRELHEMTVDSVCAEGSHRFP